MRLAYSITAFPTISETFILDQITAMIDRGHDVTIFADARDDGRHGNEPVHDDVDRYQLGRFVRRRALRFPGSVSARHATHRRRVARNAAPQPSPKTRAKIRSTFLV